MIQINKLENKNPKLKYKTFISTPYDFSMLVRENINNHIHLLELLLNNGQNSHFYLLANILIEIQS